jgi:hypothetical protein
MRYLAKINLDKAFAKIDPTKYITPQPSKPMKNSFNMKSNIYTRLSVLTLAVLLAACSATPDDDKQSRLEKLKTEEQSLDERD